VTAADVLALAAELGHRVRVVEGDRLALTGADQPETPLLKRVLVLHRAEVIERLAPKPTVLDRREFRKRLEAFWHKSGWTPLGGWQTGERDRLTEVY
jgi:hypothetical protein